MGPAGTALRILHPANRDYLSPVIDICSAIDKVYTAIRARARTGLEGFLPHQLRGLAAAVR